MSELNNNSSIASSRLGMKMLVGLLLLVLIAFVWLSKGGFRHWQVDTQHLDTNGQLSVQTMTQLKQLLVEQNVSGVIQMRDDSPRLMSFISSELSTSNSPSDGYIAQLIELALLFELNVKSGTFTDDSLIIEVGAPLVDQFQNQLMNHKNALVTNSAQGEYAPGLAKQNLIANSAKFLAVHYEEEQLGRFHELLFDVYQTDKQRRSPHKALEKGLLEALWISARRDNGEWIQQYLSISNENEEQLFLEKESDLFKLLDSNQTEVVINAARVIGSINPPHAATSLRYRLTKAKNQRVKFALLEAIGHFGEEVDVLEPQLKRMQQVTNDEDLRHKIKLTLDQLRGRSA